MHGALGITRLASMNHAWLEESGCPHLVVAKNKNGLYDEENPLEQASHHESDVTTLCIIVHYFAGDANQVIDAGEEAETFGEMYGLNFSPSSLK